MAQSAYNDTMDIDIGPEWTLVSEVDCTFGVNYGAVEVIGMDGAAPSHSVHGIIYRQDGADDAATATLARFPGAGTADRIYMRAIGQTANVFVSRAAT